MRRSCFLSFFLLVSVLARAADVPDLEKRVVEHTFPNGIKLLVLERHFSPTVAIRMMFRVGSVDENAGKTGLAHMFEHMMFKGTHTLGTKNYAQEAPLIEKIDHLHQDLDDEKSKGTHANQARIADLIQQLRSVEEKEATLVQENELWNLYEREGASQLNAATSHDFTQYTVNLPSNKLELWALLDSDRLRAPVFRQFYPEREVVKEERRMRVDTDPEGKLYEHLLATAFLSHPYRHPTIGWESDLDHLSVDDLQRFYRTYYTPDQLTIAVVGDVQAPNVIRLVEKYFGPWQAKSKSTHRDPPTEEPPMAGPRRVVVRMPAQPRILYAAHIPAYPDPDHPVAYVIGQLLGSGTTSRLYKTLVEKKKLATSVETGTEYPGERYGSLLILAAQPRYPHTADEVEQAFAAEIERLQREPIAEWELEKVRASLEVGLLNSLQTNDGMADTLVYDQTIFGDWRYLLEFQKRIRSLTTAEIQRAAQKLFMPNNKIVAVLESVKK